MNAELQTAPETVKGIERGNVVELDVRPTLRSGGEPFSLIMGAVDDVPPGGALRLRATFEPAPLFRVLGGKGWKHWTEHGEGEDWIIWFYRDDGPPQPVDWTPVIAQYPELPKRLRTDANEWTLDVRDLAPPDPLEMTLAVLDHLPRGGRLIQLNQRVPQFLFPLLDERGMHLNVLEEGTDQIRIEIKHR